MALYATDRHVVAVDHLSGDPDPTFLSAALIWGETAFLTIYAIAYVVAFELGKVGH